METVIIQGTDFAKEFEKPNDRASHIKIGRAKQVWFPHIIILEIF